MAAGKDELSEVYRRYREDEKVTRRWSSENPGNRLILAERSATITRLLSTHFSTDAALDVLDLGCGGATALPPGINIARRIGIDILFERLPVARDTGLLHAVACADGARLPFPDSTFDLIVISTVVSSVAEPTIRRGIAQAATRVLRPGGAILWYDMRYPNPANRNIHPVTAKELRTLFPTLEHSITSITVVPQLARRLGERPSLYRRLSGIGVLHSHLIGLLTKPRHGSAQSPA